MKKISLICAILLAGLSLSACSNMASQPHKASSSSSSAKVVKHHHRKAHKRANKQSSSSSSVVSSASSSNESTGVAKANNVSNNQSATFQVLSVTITTTHRPQTVVLPLTRLIAISTIQKQSTWVRTVTPLMTIMAVQLIKELQQRRALIRLVYMDM